MLRCLAAGWTTRQIAKGLSYSDRTVKSDLGIAAAKLNALNRTHAVAIALRTGLLDGDRQEADHDDHAQPAPDGS